MTTGGDLHDNNPVGSLLNHASSEHDRCLSRDFKPDINGQQGNDFRRHPVLCPVSAETRRGVTIIEWQLAGQGAGCTLYGSVQWDNCELSIIGTHRVLARAQYLSSSPRDCHHTALCALWPPLNRCSQLGPLSCIFCANKHHYYFHMSSTLIICHSLYRSLIELLQ